MTPHRKKCPHVVHFNVPRDWFEINSRHQKRYSEDGKKFRGCRGLLGRVICSTAHVGWIVLGEREFDDGGVCGRSLYNSLLRLLNIIELLWSYSAKKTGSPRPPL